MTTQQVIKYLVEVEHQLARRKNNALARGRWADAIKLEAQIELSETTRHWIASMEGKELNATPPTPSN